MCEYSNKIENPQKDCSTISATNIKSVQNLVKKFEQLNYVPPYKVRTDSKLKVRKYLSLNIMNEDSNYTIPTLDENVVNKFLQTENSSFKSSGSVRESKSKSEREQKKRSESFRQENKNSGKCDGNKKTSDTFLNKYFRSLSDPKASKRNGNPVRNSKWYSNDATPKTNETKTKRNEIDDIGKKKSKEQTNSNGFDGIPKKKSKEQTNSNGFDGIPKKKSKEQANANGFDGIPKKNSKEQTNSNGFDGISKKKSKEQANVDRFEDIPKKNSKEQTNSNGFDDTPQKKSKEHATSNKCDDTSKEKSKELNSNENCEIQNVSLRRKSYVLAMQTNYSVDIDIDEPRKEENKNSYVSQILSKFEDKQSNTMKQEVKSDVDRLFKNYHRKAKITGENREKLSLEINDILLEKYKQLKYSTNGEQQLGPSNSKTESPTSPEENEEIECITLVYNEDDGKLTRYSEEECRNMETKYMITLNETLNPDDSTKINEQKIEEIKVIKNGSTLDLNANEDEDKSNVQELCDKIQEQLNDVIKNIEIEEISIMGTKTPEDKAEENIFEFWKRQNTSAESIQTMLKPDEIKNPDMGYDTEEEKTQHIDKESENINKNTDTQVAEEDVPNITNQRRSSYLFSSVSTNSDMSDDKPRVSRLYSGSFKKRSQQANEENKCKAEARNSILNSLRFSFKSNCDEDNDKRNRRSFRSSLFGDKREENKSDGRRNSYMNRRKSSVASCSSPKNELPETSGNKEDITSENNKRESIASSSSYTNDEISQTNNTFESSEALNTSQKNELESNASCESDKSKDSSKKLELLEVNRHSFLNVRRNSYTSNISKTNEKIPKRSESFKRQSSRKEYEEISSADKVLLNENSSSSNNSVSNKEQQSMLYSRKNRSSLTGKSKKEDPKQEEPLTRQDTPRLSRLYNKKIQYNSKSTTEKKDDNNNNCEASKKKTNSTVLQFESDNEDETVETSNPYFSYISRDAYTKEWVENTVEHLALQNVKEPEPIEEKQFSAQLRKTVDKDGLKTCTVYDEQNNPAIRLSCYDMDEFSAEFDDEQMKINQSEKQYRESIEDIQNNSQLACLIAELKSTEQNYVKISLRRLVEDYMAEMNRTDIPLNLVGKVRTIFGNADILYENHKSKFLPDLEASHSVEDIANCFLKYEEKIFKYYPLYTKNKPKSELIMRDYADFFKRKQEILRDRLDLSSYLLTPIQRMAKYCQLVKSMAKECEKEGKPSQKLHKASEMLAKLMGKGNDLIALDSILNFDGDLRQEGDLLLRDVFYVQAPNRKQSYEGMIFLFQESILITQIIRHNGSEYFDYQDSIKVCDMGYTDNEAEPLVFKIWYRKRDQKNYVIRANKIEKQQKWVKEIFNLLWKQLEANKMRKKKEYEESGLNEIKVLLPRPISEPNNKYTMFKSRSNSTMKKKSSSETIWYSTFIKKFDFNDS